VSQVIRKYAAPFLVYDESCLLCLRFKQALERTKVNDKVSFYPLQDSKLYLSFPFLDPLKTKEIVHFIDSHHNVYTGKDAVEHLVKLDPKVKRFAWLIESKMGQIAIDLFYKTSNRYRKSLRKCCKTCDH